MIFRRPRPGVLLSVTAYMDGTIKIGQRAPIARVSNALRIIADSLDDGHLELISDSAQDSYEHEGQA